ncbi:MAG: phosphate ABC transporter substrate-binding protein [Pseudomonadota bacterium]
MKLIQVAKIVALSTLCFSPLAGAGVAVIVHPSVSTNTLMAEAVKQVFLGRASALPDGTAVAPVDQAEGSAVRAQFVERVLGKNEQQLRSYWARMIFTGKGQPPRGVTSAAEMLKTVASSPGFIGYVDTKDVVPGKVKVLYSIE